jgi:hypothetical protein
MLVFFGAHQSTPDPQNALRPAGGGLGAATEMLFARGGGTDFLIDYSSARALAHRENAYDISSVLTARAGVPWAISTANPHPPTLLPLVMPFLVVKYQWAMAGWALAMTAALALTTRLAGIRAPYALVIGFGLALTFPGAYGIGNPVPLVGLGVVLAYRHRNEPALAGAGLMLAAAPKLSGVILVAAFVGAGRVRAALWGTGFLALLAVIPIAFQPDVWSRYLDAGVHGAQVNKARADNAALLHLGEKWDIPTIVGLAVLGVVALLLVVLLRDLYLPSVWLMVAALPIAWMYSALTFLPVAVWIFRRNSPVARCLVILATALMLASSPAGHWPVVIFPMIVVLFLGAIVAAYGEWPLRRGRDAPSGAFAIHWPAVLIRNKPRPAA